MRGFLYSFVVVGRDYPEVLFLAVAFGLLVFFGALVISYFVIAYLIFFSVNNRVFLLSPLNMNLANNFLSGSLRITSLYNYLGSFVFWIIYYCINLIIYNILFEASIVSEFFNNNIFLQVFVNIGIFLSQLDKFLFLIIFAYLSLGIWNSAKRLKEEKRMLFLYTIRFGLIFVWFNLLNLNKVLNIF